MAVIIKLWRGKTLKTEIITYNEVEGLHQWATAPQGNYLKNQHRHVFVIRCWFEVSHSDRDIEFINKQREIQKALHWRFYENNLEMFNFGEMSCEMIAQWLIEEIGCTRAVVLEDRFGGADVSKV